MSGTLTGKNIVIVGGSRGLGAQQVIACTREGANVLFTYQTRKRDAENVCERTRNHEGSVQRVLKFDIADRLSRYNLCRSIVAHLGDIDAVLLNAAGGLDSKDALEPIVINHRAQIDLLDSLLEPPEGEGFSNFDVIYLTSMWAHQWGQALLPPTYGGVAYSKHKCERALLSRSSSVNSRLRAANVRISILCAHVVRDTIMEKLFRRHAPALHEELRGTTERGAFPTAEEVAEEIVTILAEPKWYDRIRFVGGHPSLLPVLSAQDFYDRSAIEERLPHGPEAVYLDSFERSYSRHARASLTVREAWCAGHFPPPLPRMMPGQLLGEAAAQALGLLWFSTHMGTNEFLPQLESIEHEEFHDPALPGDTLRLSVKLEHEHKRGFFGSVVVSRERDTFPIASFHRISVALIPAGLVERKFSQSSAEVSGE